MSKSFAHEFQRIRTGLLIASLGGLLFTFDLPLLRLAGLDRWTMVGARGIFLFLSISAVWWALHRSSGMRPPYIAGMIGLAVAATSTIANIAYIGAVVETHAANVVFISALIPLITALMSRILIGERVHPLTWIACAASFAGVGIIVWDSLGRGRVEGDILALVAACCVAWAFTAIRASRKDLTTSLAIGSLASALVALTMFPTSLHALFLPSSLGVPAVMWIALNGLVAIPLASALIANGPRFLPSADVSMFFLLETVLTPVWVWLLFGEMPSRMVVFGGLIVIVTLIVHSLWRFSATLKSASPAYEFSD
jgi:drug/metabolite transporter (DMT)-like permease